MWAIIITIITQVISGLVFQKLWEWFIVPTFAVSSLTLPIAMGIVLIFGFITHQYIPIDESDLLTMAIDNLLLPLVSLVIGFLIHCLV